MIDFNFENNTQLKPGSILISEPFLADDYFSRSVIFLVDHNKDGSFGFVLNKYIENELTDFIKNFPQVDVKVSLGGPVETSSLFYVHSLGDMIPNSIPCTKDLFIGGEFQKLRELLIINPELITKVRFFIGYSGWEKEQLNDELKEKSWIVLNDISKDIVLDTNNENIWEETLRKLGGKFKVMSGFPINPSDN